MTDYGNVMGNLRLLRQQIAFMPRLERFFFIFWLSGPFLYLIERSPADIWLSLVGLGFLFHSWQKQDWHWLNWGWVRAIGLFWAVMLGVSLISVNPAYAIGEAIIWIRFPLYAVACAAWIGNRRERIDAMLMAMGVASLIMMVILGLEIVSIGSIGDRLQGPYGDLIPGSFLGKSMMPLAVALSAICISARPKYAIPAMVVAGALAIFTLFTGERMNTLLICTSLLLGAFTHEVRLKRIFLAGTIALAVFVGLALASAGIRNMLSPGRPEVSNYFQSEYWFSMRPGIVSFLDSSLSGIGVGMHRLVCPQIGDGPAWLPGQNSCHPHAHQFYVQMAEEVGIFGFVFGVAALGAIILHAWRQRQGGNLYANIAWVMPFLMFFPQPSADFFGQWNNLFLWFAVGLAMAMAATGGNGKPQTHRQYM